MKAEFTLPEELVNQIADKVIEKIKPVIVNHGKRDTEDTIFDVPALAEYLKVSTQWIYNRTHLNEIPFIKKQGLLRFRKRDSGKEILIDG